MYADKLNTDNARYAKCIEVSKRIRWDIETDLIRGRKFSFNQKFLPDGLSKINEMHYLNADEKRLLSQIQGRTYANIFGLVERFINAKVLEISQEYWLGDQTALEALVRFSDEELKHQALFRQIEVMIGKEMPAGYQFNINPDEVASVVLGKSTWAVLALTCHIELFTQAHYKQSIEPDHQLSELFKDIFLYHWKEESQHAILDELEWKRTDASLTAEQRDAAVNDFIALVGAVDGILQHQSAADVNFFVSLLQRKLSQRDVEQLSRDVLRAYRWQYIVSGAGEPRFVEIITNMISQAQWQRIEHALAPIVNSVSLN